MKNLLSLYDREMRVEIEYPDVQKDATRDVVRFIRPAPGMNMISFSRFDVSSTDAIITEQLAFFAPYQQPLTWKVYNHDKLCATLKERLPAFGFEPDDEYAAVMLLDVSAAPEVLLAPAQLDIRRISQRDGLQDVIYVLESVWGSEFNWVNQRLGRHLEIPGYLSVYVAYSGSRPVSVAWTYFNKGQFASLFAGSTLLEFRRKGFYCNILATRIKEIRKRGYRYAIVEAGKMSRPIVARVGFRHLTTVWDYEYKRDDNTVK